MMYSNIVKKPVVRKVQLEALKQISDSLITSFGPMGSNSAIRANDVLTKYTKDGHSILQGIQFRRPIEYTVKEDLEGITRHIVKTVGDGTTSAIMLAALIFKNMAALEARNTTPPIVLVERFKNEVNKIIEEIMTHKKVVTVDDIYKIALISTNGNRRVAQNLKDIYAEHGNNVFIDVTISNTEDDQLKIYDGLTLDAGYADPAFINNPKDKNVSIRNPKIYIFEDPIDTEEMRKFMNVIIHENIVSPLEKKSMPIATVIVAPKIGRDSFSYVDQVIESIASAPANAKPPLVIVTNVVKMDYLADIARLSGARFIKKYIDPKIQAIDIKNGNAPTPSTIDNFAGSCDLVVSDYGTTKFINPKKMFNEDGSKSDIYAGLISSLEGSLQNAIDNKETIKVTGALKRRINSLKANMVEYLVGGISINDRDSLRDLVEDAVLNCRSAAEFGFGFGANFEGLRATNKLSEKDPENIILSIITKAYGDLTILLYNTATLNTKRSIDIMIKSIKSNSPYNIRTGKFDGSVLASIKSDTIVLDAIAQIVTIMFTCSQYLTQTPMHNDYVDEVVEVEELEKNREPEPTAESIIKMVPPVE